MSLPTTEKLPEHPPFDALSAAQAVSVMVSGQRAALDAVERAGDQIELGADAMAKAIAQGGRLIYCAAGSSGLMALADACELPGTFGISPKSIQIHMAGGVPADGLMPGDTEDDVRSAARLAEAFAPRDVVIVLSASGTTPYALEIAKAATSRGATVVGIANNPDTSLLSLAHVAICLETPAEVIGGSTRLAAGTAQKVALNLMSSRMGVKLGHVYCGHMVNVVADNSKLIKRAIGIVSTIADVSESAAKQALEQADGNVKQAVLVAAGGTSETAKNLLKSNGGHLGPCLNTLKSNHDLRV